MLTNNRMQIYDANNQRLYINADERRRFLDVSRSFPAKVRSLCLVLAFTGCRISEALALERRDIQLTEQLIAFRTLKRRQQHIIREVPLPFEVINEIAAIHTLTPPLNDTCNLLWHKQHSPVHRSTAYRWIKKVMSKAGIVGVHATPKGLRHGYGIQATRARIPTHMLQKWMGHSSMNTTTIYATASGPEELYLAIKMWS